MDPVVGILMKGGEERERIETRRYVSTEAETLEQNIYYLSSNRIASLKKPGITRMSRSTALCHPASLFPELEENWLLLC